jgi:hypothetical protein
VAAGTVAAAPADPSAPSPWWSYLVTLLAPIPNRDFLRYFFLSFFTLLFGLKEVCMFLMFFFFYFPTVCRNGIRCRPSTVKHSAHSPRQAGSSYTRQEI